MRRNIAALFCAAAFTLPAHAQQDSFGPGNETRHLGGLMLFFQPGETTVSLGGILFPRRVTTTTQTPAGPVVTRFRLPAVIASPESIPFRAPMPAALLVDIPDQVGLLYLNGELLPTKGTTRQLESPLLPVGTAYPLTVRGVFVVGDQLLIEDRTVMLRAGESIRLSFDGKQALAAVPLRKDVGAIPVSQTAK